MEYVGKGFSAQQKDEQNNSIWTNLVDSMASITGMGQSQRDYARENLLRSQRMAELAGITSPQHLQQQQSQSQQQQL
eukprot:UN05283